MPDLSDLHRWAVPALVLSSLVGTPVVLWWERRHPSAWSRQPEALAAWRALPAEAQEAYDTAVLNASEAAAARAAGRDAPGGDVRYRP